MLQNDVGINLKDLKWGDLVWIDLPKGEKHEQYGRRPGIVVTSDVNNIYSPKIGIIPFTTQDKHPLPIHQNFKKDEIDGLTEDCTLLVEQFRNISKSRIFSRCGSLNELQKNIIKRKWNMQYPIGASA